MTEQEKSRRAQRHVNIAFAIFFLLPFALLIAVPVSNLDVLSQVMGVLTYFMLGVVSAVVYLTVAGWRYRH